MKYILLLIYLLLISISCASKCYSEWTEIYKSIEQNKDVLTKEVIIEKTQLNTREQFILCLLPPNQSILYEHQIQHPFLKKLFLAKQFHFNLDVANSMESLNELFSLSESEDEIEVLIYNEARILAIDISSFEDFNYEFLETEFKIHNSLNWDELCDIEKYHYLKVLLLRARHLKNLSKYKDSFVATDYGLHLFSMANLKSVYPKTYSQFLSFKAELFRSDDLAYYAIPLYQESMTILESLKNIDILQTSVINFASVYLDLKDTIRANELYKKAEELNPNKVPFNLMYAHVNDGVYQNEKNRPNAAIEHFHQALNYYESVDCSIYKSKILYFMVSSFIQLNQLDSASYYLQKMLPTDACSQAEKDKINYYAQWGIQDILRKQYDLNPDLSYLKSSLASLLEERRLAGVIYRDEAAFHLGDYYTANCSMFLTDLISSSSDVFQLEYIDILIQLFSDSKQRTLKNQRIANKLLNTPEDNEITSYLRKINDHKANDNYDDEAYEYLYKYGLSSDVDSEVSTTSSFNFNINYSILQERLDSLNTQVIEYLYYGGQYFYLHITPKTIFVGKLEEEVSNIEINQFQSEIAAKKVTDNISYLDLLPNIAEAYKNVCIIGDGLLQEFSFDAIMPKSFLIRTHIGIHEFMKDSLINLGNQNSILSYSSKETLKIKNPNNKYVELKGGYQECLFIDSILNYSHLLTGTDFTFQALSQSMSSDILHLSTHAYSDTAARLESYFLARNPDGSPRRIYADEILKMDQVPKFVNLSACDTGTGVTLAGEGTYSISRSFLQRGSQAVLKTLWKVDDQGTKDFMINFYSYWKSGLTLGEALHKTRNDFRAKNILPYYWSGFVLEGNPYLKISQSVQ